MIKPKWTISSSDGKDYTVTDDPSKIPPGARPAPLHQRPSMDDLERFSHQLPPGSGVVTMVDESGNVIIIR